MKRLCLTALSGVLFLGGCQMLAQMAQHELKPAVQKLGPQKTIEEILMQKSIQRALSEFDSSQGHKALAISESGIWGISGNTNSKRWAEWEAMRNCVTKLGGIVHSDKNVKRDCFLYALDDQVFEQTTDKLASGSPRTPFPEFYDVSLNKNSSMAFEKHLQHTGNKAFAISPGGKWAHAFGFEHPEDAAERALRLCDNTVGLLDNDSPCLLYALNGEEVVFSH